MIECVLDVTGTSPSQIWSGPGTMRGTTSPTRTDAVGLCALTTLRYSGTEEGVRVDLDILCIQRELRETPCSQLMMSKLMDLLL